MGAPLRVQVTFPGDICPGIIIQVDIHLGTHSRVRSFHHGGVSPWSFSLEFTMG